MCMQLTAAEHRCVLVETEVREEVSNEMADLLRSMEASYKVQPCLLIDAYTNPLLCVLNASYPLVGSGLVLRLTVRMQPLRLGNVGSFSMHFICLPGTCCAKLTLEKHLHSFSCMSVAASQERLAAETLLIEKRFAREGRQLARRENRRAAQTTAPAQEEQFGRLQAQLKEAQAAADKHCADVAALTVALAEKDAAAAEQMTVVESLQAQLRHAQQEAASHHQDMLQISAQLNIVAAEGHRMSEEVDRIARSSDQNLAAASEHIQQLQAEADGLIAELSQVRRQMEEAAAQHAEAEEQLRQQLRVEMQERIIQLNVSSMLLKRNSYGPAHAIPAYSQEHICVACTADLL